MSTSLRLYELTQQHRELERLLDGDEVPAEVVRDTLESIAGLFESKATSVAHVILNLEGFADQVKAAADAMKERAERIKRRADAVRAWLLLNMQATGITKIETPEFTLAVQKNPPSVEIDPLAVLPPEYMETPPPPPPKPNKAKLKEDLRSGVVIPGAYLKQGEHLRIRS